MAKEIKNVLEQRGEIVFYQTEDKKVRLEVTLELETVWLTQQQIAKLFGTQRPAITKHLQNIFKSKELQEDSVCSVLEHTASDKKNTAPIFITLTLLFLSERFANDEGKRF